MFHLRLATVWIAAAVLCFGVGTAAATDYAYDFDNGRVVAGLLTTSETAGQDNWVMKTYISDGRAAMVTDYSTSGYTGIEGFAVTRGGADSFDSRVNDTNWSYSIPAATAFSVEFNLLLASSGTIQFALAVDDVNAGVGIHNSNEVGALFGCSINKWYVRGAGFGTGTTSATGLTAGEVYRVVLDVNPTANLGNGEGSLSVQLLTGDNPDPNPVAVTDLQNINLGLLDMYDSDPSHWDGMFVRLGDGGIMDNLTITVGGSPPRIPGDANNSGTVDDVDASILAAHWQQSGGWGDGDFNGDNIVNDQDASILAAHWQQTSEGTAQVPEPGMGILLIGGVLALLVFRRRKPAR